MARKKGNIIRGIKKKFKKSPKNIKKKCSFGVNKYTGKCLKSPRKK